MSGHGAEYRKAIRAFEDRIKNLRATLSDSPTGMLRIKESRLALADLEVCQEHGVEGLVFARAEQDRRDREIAEWVAPIGTDKLA